MDRLFVLHGKLGHPANGVQHRCCVVFEALENGETTAASPGIALRVPRPAAFDNPPSGTEFREARGASRGNACLDSKNPVSLSLRFGLQSTGLVLSGTGEASPSKRAARRSAVRCSLAASGRRLAVGLGEKGATWNAPLVRSLLPLGFQATSALSSEGVPMPTSERRKRAKPGWRSEADVQ
ncbi:MAG: hypothetical protein RLZZ622_1012 [Planctomycetota bacterium]